MAAIASYRWRRSGSISSQYHERYQAIIEDYNSQQDRANIEKTFDELMKLVQSMAN